MKKKYYIIIGILLICIFAVVLYFIFHDRYTINDWDSIMQFAKRLKVMSV